MSYRTLLNLSFSFKIQMVPRTMTGRPPRVVRSMVTMKTQITVWREGNIVRVIIERHREVKLTHSAITFIDSMPSRMLF